MRRSLLKQSVCHKHDSFPSGSTYRNMLCIVRFTVIFLACGGEMSLSRTPYRTVAACQMYNTGLLVLNHPAEPSPPPFPKFSLRSKVLNLASIFDTVLLWVAVISTQHTTSVPEYSIQVALVCGLPRDGWLVDVDFGIWLYIRCSGRPMKMFMGGHCNGTHIAAGN